MGRARVHRRACVLVALPWVEREGMAPKDKLRFVVICDLGYPRTRVGKSLAGGILFVVLPRFEVNRTGSRTGAKGGGG